MTLPLQSDVHVNQLLTQISIAYMQDEANFVAAKVFPNIPVQKQSDRYLVILPDDFNRDEMEVRAPGTKSKRGGYRIDNTPTYFANVWAYGHEIPEQLRANSDGAFSLDAQATELVTRKALIRREKLFVANYFRAGVWGTDYQGVASGPSGNQFLQWSDAGSDPIRQVKSAKRAMQEATGYMPNTLTLGAYVYDAVSLHPDFIDRVRYGGTNNQPAMINQAAMAALFEVERILVMAGIENTAAEGLAGAHSFIGGNHALLTYTPPRPGLMTPSAGYTFSWTGYTGNGIEGNRISQWYDQDIKSDIVEIEMAFDQKVVASALGMFFEDVI